jgi:Mlc titration factor MtfA (ptsG expression regulator)
MIAAQAALLVLGLDDLDPYRGVDTIIVHASTVTLTGERAGPAGTVSSGPFPVLGLAQYAGPIVIAWDEALANARHPERGHNVVYHEFAHKLDMLDGLVDGTPPLHSRAALERWVEVCTREYQALQRGENDPILDPYGAVSTGEFFAVVTELFFDVPIELEERKPELYAVLRDYYRQDPAVRIRSHSRLR